MNVRAIGTSSYLEDWRVGCRFQDLAQAPKPLLRPLATTSLGDDFKE